MSPNAPWHPAVESQTSASTAVSLLAGLRDQEPAAWERLVSLYAPLVYYWCRKMGLAEQDMTDVFQDVFQSVAKRVGEFHKDGPGDTFRGWLRTITRNKVLDHFRRESRQPHAAGGTTAQLRLSQLPAAPLSEDESSQNGPAEDESFRELFRFALARIKDRFQEQTWQAFWRVVIEGKTAHEVARELSMRPGTVRVAKSRVLHRLRTELGDLKE